MPSRRRRWARNISFPTSRYARREYCRMIAMTINSDRVPPMMEKITAERGRVAQLRMI